MSLKKFVVNKARPLPVIILADTSGSMSINGKIDALNLSIKDMISSFASESRLRAEIHLSVVTFGSKAATHLPLTPAHQIEQIENFVAQGTTLPFFCDDIFETFDEARTSAACRVMETIGGRGQAIYLTHHRHVVAIAQSVCTTPPIVHEL